MNPALLQIPAAFGLAGASGLNATLPLLIVSLLARLGLVHLAHVKTAIPPLHLAGHPRMSLLRPHE